MGTQIKINILEENVLHYSCKVARGTMVSDVKIRDITLIIYRKSRFKHKDRKLKRSTPVTSLIYVQDVKAESPKIGSKLHFGNLV